MKQKVITTYNSAETNLRARRNPLEKLKPKAFKQQTKSYNASLKIFFYHEHIS